MDEGWKDRYVVKQHGSVGAVWTVFSNRWHSVRPMKRISPWFSWKSEAEGWISSKWRVHVDNKLERIMLVDSDTKD